MTHADAFTTALADLGEHERVQWTRHRVKQGETIGELAETYHTTAAVLREANKLSGNTIRAGDYLLIPHATEALDELLAERGRASRATASRAALGRAQRPCRAIRRFVVVDLSPLRR